MYLPNDIEYNGTISILINVSGAGRKAGPVVLKNRIDDTVIGTLGPLGDAFMLTAIPMGGDNLIVRWAIINSFRLTW